MIDFGFKLTTPLNRSGFCTELQAAKGGFAQHECKDCSEPKMFGIVDP